ncbi:positive regulation of atf6-mediated unfolded protein response [Mactra antiquata]
METDFVSEVDRKFFANNMLSNEDWEASMELTEIMGLDSHLPNIDFVNDFQTDLQLPDTDDSFFPSTTHDDLLHDWSDSSDSGVSGLLNVNSTSDDVIKKEPLSPVDSNHSDSCDSGISQVVDPLPLRHVTTDLTSSLSSSSSLSSPQTPPVVLSSPVSSPVSPADLTLTVKSETLSSFTSNNSYTLMLDGSTNNTNIDTILNSKIPIQPKPDSLEPSSPKKSRSMTVPNGSSTLQQKSLVLTAEEFQQLTNQGVLRFQPPKQESILQQQQQQHVLPVTNINHSQTVPICTSTSNNSILVEDKDHKAMKRQQRMIKNRESASLSRKRKKEYMSSLESRLKAFSDENDKLRNENLSLKRKLSELHSENESLKKTFTITPALKKTVVLSIFIMLSLNLGSWSNIMLTDRNINMKEKLTQPLVHKGRQLMSLEEEPRTWSVDTDTVSKLHDLIMEYGGTTKEKFNVTDVPPMCPTYFNKTESMRLAEQLAGWMIRHEEEKKKGVIKQDKERKNKQIRPISTLSKAMRGDLHPMDRKIRRPLDARYQLQVYEGADSGKDFLKAIHRRNDTFYVLSFDEDYYLVPAVYHNKTSRPRMSLVMPAVALNESMMPSENHVGMMQIDCEVMNTQLIHVQKTSIPKYVREKHNSSFSKYHDGYYP